MIEKSREQTANDAAEEIRQLFDRGRTRGYVVYEEVNEALSDGVRSPPEKIEEIFFLLEADGIEIVDDETKEQLTRPGTTGPPKAKENSENEASEALLGTTDVPLRIYLREMGRVPLLTRQAEVSLARRIERGEWRVLNALSRTAYAHAETKKLGELILEGQISPKLIVNGLESGGAIATTERLSRRAGRKEFVGGAELHEAFMGLVNDGFLTFQTNSYVLTPKGRDAAANLVQEGH